MLSAVTLQQILLRAIAELQGPIKQTLFKGAATAALPAMIAAPRETRNLLIGPANSAGQAHLWARAVGLVPGWHGQNVAYVKDDRFRFAADLVAEERSVVYTPKWARALRMGIVEGCQAVLDESLLPLFGSVHFQSAASELRYLKRRGVSVGVICHGSDVRLPSVQVEVVPGSVFRDADPEDVKVLQQQAERNNKLLDELGYPTFVSTPDQLLYRPDATWLPLQVAPGFMEDAEREEQRDTPTVMHLPSRGYLKGSQWIEPQMRALQELAVIRYLSPDKVPHAEMKQLMEQADIVIDAVGMGAYGVTSVEAMALGKVVVGEVSQFVRAKIEYLTGQEVPIVEASADTLTAVIEELAADVDRRDRLARDGVAYVHSVHSPAAAASALAPFLETATRM